MRCLTALLIALLAAGPSGTALAAPVCVDPDAATRELPGFADAGGAVGGMGGTGRSPGEGGGIGGTGAPAARAPGDGGIGGTGAPIGRTDGGDGGIGGTGSPLAQGDTVGIVGIVTGFASVCVNGLEVHYEADTPVSENGRTAHVGNLAVGQFVSIDARASAGGLRASDIAIVHLIEGPLSMRPGGGFAVMGQPIELLENARVETPDALTPRSSRPPPRGC